MHFLLLIFHLSKTISGHFSLFSSYRNIIVFLMPIASCGETGTEEVLSLEGLVTLPCDYYTDLMLQQQRNISTIFRNIIKGIGLQFICRGSLRCWLLNKQAIHALSWASTTATEITWESDIPILVLNCGICCPCFFNGIQDCWPLGLTLRPISSLRPKKKKGLAREGELLGAGEVFFFFFLNLMCHSWHIISSKVMNKDYVLIIQYIICSCKCSAKPHMW